MNYTPAIQRGTANIYNWLRQRPVMLFTNILVTYHCTQRCRQCTIPSQKSATPFISADNFAKILDHLTQYGTQGISLSGGEPMSHPHLPGLIALAAKKKFLNLQLLTTLYASDKRVEQTIRSVFDHNVTLSCSFDGFGTVADNLRGAKNVSQRVQNNIMQFHLENSKRRHPVKTFLNLVLSQVNLHQVPEILEFAERIQWRLNVDLYRWASDNHREQDDMKITDFDLLHNMLERIKQSPVVYTPQWLLDGYVNYLDDHFAKQCPYTDNHALGSKFFIHPNGDIHVCVGKQIGNILESTPEKIFSSPAWRDKSKEFHTCKGCWNTCYTPSAKLSNYLNLNGLQVIRRLTTRGKTAH
jgi:MoaA/NifB/PqqE/SkfB family radical SAM enzyme